MEKQYRKISEKIGVPPQGIHLVHYVLNNMKALCVFPPRSMKSTDSFFAPVNICSAIFAYLNHYHAEDPWGTLGKFGIKSSKQVGLIAKALQESRKTKAVANLEVVVDDFKGIFST